jgi:hypothetical protein
MKPKTIVGIVLLVFAAGSIVYLVASEALQEDEPADPNGAAALPGPDDGVVVTYFLNNVRCPTCIKIEAYTKEAVEEGFADALKDGRVVWRTVNTDEPASKHFIDDYNLVAKSVVVSQRRGGKEVDWEDLNLVWELVGDKKAFLAYIRDEVAARLEEN